MTNIDFSERLSELMLLEDLTIISLSQKSGCSKTGISFWIKYNTYPTIKNIIKLADYFNCTIDYFLGLSDDSSKHSFTHNFKFAERLDLLVKSKKLSYYQLAKDLGFDERYFTRWKQNVIPKTETLIIIAKYFNVSLDYLVGRSDIQ